VCEGAGEIASPDGVAAKLAVFDATEIAQMLLSVRVGREFAQVCEGKAMAGFRGAPHERQFSRA